MKEFLKDLIISWNSKNKPEKSNGYTFFYTLCITAGSLFADNIALTYVYNFPYYLKLEDINLQI